MKKFFVISLTLVFLTSLSIASVPDTGLWERAKRIQESALLVDGHNDLPWALRKANDMGLQKYDLNKIQLKFHTDIPRLRKGGMGAQFWSVYVPSTLMQSGEAVKVTREQIELVPSDDR